MTMKRGAWGLRWGEGARLAEDDSDIRFDATAERSLLRPTPGIRGQPRDYSRVVRGRGAARIRLKICGFRASTKVLTGRKPKSHSKVLAECDQQSSAAP